MYSLDQELAFATQKVREQRAVIATLQSELAAAKESRDRESVAYDKLNAAYIDLNLELSKLRTTEYEYLLGEKDAQIDALRAKSTELKTSPLYACACEQFYDGKHHPECPARRQWEELQSDLAAAREEIARAPVCVGYVKNSDAKYMPQINQEMVLIVKGLSLLCPENGYQPIYIDPPECNASHKGEEG